MVKHQLKPKAATIAAGPLRVQVTHYLGKDGTDGNGNPFGNFTIEGDVDHLDIHAVTQTDNVQNFTVNTANKIGEIRVTSRKPTSTNSCYRNN